jgi:aminomethyltransferase
VQSLQSTPLNEQHRALGARLVPFAGFEMPLHYTGIVDEHRAVRTAAGLFDVSHMGQFIVSGSRAIQELQRAVTNDVEAMDVGQALYTPICRHDGGIVDDCVIYRQASDRALVVVNAANVSKDFQWFSQQFDGRCQLRDASAEYGLIALQGPEALRIADGVLVPSRAVERFRFADGTAAGRPCTIARTGYTGEDGFEILCKADDAPAIWLALVEAGTPLGLKPAGLGCRDTLRLEARLLLHGSDIDEDTSPLEAGLGWTVKFDKGDFCGREALAAQRRDGLRRRLCCLVMRSRGIARQGHQIFVPAEDGSPGAPVGRVTSGTMSPTLGQAVALGYVSRERSKAGQQLVIDVRGRAVAAEVVKGPFYRRAQER